MQKLITILVGALLTGAAFAVELVGDGELVLVASGEVVGVGEIEGGDLDLELLAGFSGFATLTFVDAEGNEFHFDVMVDSDSSVTFSESFDELEDAVPGETTVSTREELEASGNMAFGAAVPVNVDLPGVAQEGMDRAEENAEEARERAEEARERGEEASSNGDGEASVEAEGRARGEAAAEARGDNGDENGAEAEAGAEAEVGIGVEVGPNDEED